MQPAPAPVQAPPLQPVQQPQLAAVPTPQPIQGGFVPGVLPGAFGGVGQTINANSTPAGVLSNALFG